MAASIDMPFLDPARIAMGGVSRGGALSIAYAGTHSGQVSAVINFVGGWLGWPCPTMGSVNPSLFNRGATYPGDSIWVYATNDAYYSLSHSRENFTKFSAAGGHGMFYAYVVPVENGHWLPAFPDLWSKDLDAYLTHMGLPSRDLESRLVDSADAKSRVADQPCGQLIIEIFLKKPQRQLQVWAG